MYRRCASLAPDVRGHSIDLFRVEHVTFDRQALRQSLSSYQSVLWILYYKFLSHRRAGVAQIARLG